MSRGNFVGDAELLRVLAQLDPSEHEAAALAFGRRRPAPWQATPPTVDALRPPRLPDSEAGPSPPPAPPPAPPPIAPDDAEQPVFWRIESHLPDETAQTDTPAWLRDEPSPDPAMFVRDPAAPPFEVAPLVPPARLAAFLRRHLAREQPCTQPDLPRIVRRIAQRRAVVRWPAMRRPRWPARVNLVLDTGWDLLPLRHDLLPLLAQMQRLLGPRARVYAADGDPADTRDAAGKPATLPADGASMVVLGDAALNGTDAAARRRWLDAARRQQRTGPRPLLLGALPARRLDAATAEAFDVALLDDGPRLRLATRSRAAARSDEGRASGASRGGGEGGDGRPRALASAPSPAAGAADAGGAVPIGEGARELRAALYGNSYVTPALLRALRRELRHAGLPADLGSEVEVWHDAAVASGAAGCALRPERRDEIGREFDALPAAPRDAVAALHWRALAATSPLVRAEYQRAVLPRLADGLPAEKALRDATREVERLERAAAIALHVAAGSDGDLAVDLGAYHGRLGRRDAAQIGAGRDALQAAWALAHRTELAAGTVDPPPGLRLERLRWLLGGASADRPMALRVAGRAKSDGEALPVELRYEEAAAGTPGGALLKLHGEHVCTVESFPDSDARDRRCCAALLGWIGGDPDRARDVAACLVASTLRRAPDDGSLRAASVIALEGAGQGGIPARTGQSGLPAGEDVSAVEAGAEGAGGADGTGASDDADGAAATLAARLLSVAAPSAPASEALAAELRGWVWRDAGPATDAGPAIGAPMASDKLPEPSLAHWLSPRLPADAAAALEAALPDAGETHAALRAGEAAPLDPDRRWRVRAGGSVAVLEAFVRLPWADAVERDGERLAAVLPDGRRLRWTPRTRWRIDGVADGYVPPHALWWDEAEHDAWFGSDGVVRCPSWAVRHGVDGYGYWAEFEVGGVVQRMRFIPPGRFLMGSPKSEPGWRDNERQHAVTLTRAFWLADTACTQALWRAVTGESPSRFEDDDEAPVEQVSWDDATGRFLPALNARVSGLEAALPGETQWEYACRAGSEGSFWFGEQIDSEQVNFNGNHPMPGGRMGEYRGHTVGVKGLPANGWGLYQMHGNVWEWCADEYGPYAEGEAVDPVAAGQGLSPKAGSSGPARRALRGGSWFFDARRCRSAYRSVGRPSARNDLIGLRLARGLAPAGGRAEPTAGSELAARGPGGALALGREALTGWLGIDKGREPGRRR